jgi:TRAP-type C4-dicarboxylate transport system permease small subunit
MQPDNKTFALLNNVVTAVAIACGWALLALCALTGYDILARRLLGHSVQGVDEIGGYILAITASVGFAAALLNRMHTRIDLVLVIMPPRLRAVMNTFAALCLAGFALFMAQKAFVTLNETLEFGSRASTPLQTPLWIPQSLWIMGILLFAIISCVMAAHATWLLFRGQIDTINKQYGPPSIDEETEASLAMAGPQINPEGLNK